MPLWAHSTFRLAASSQLQAVSSNQKRCLAPCHTARTTQGCGPGSKAAAECLKEGWRCPCAISDAAVACNVEVINSAGACDAPQVCPYGLYAEQLSGTAFTMPRRCCAVDFRCAYWRNLSAEACRIAMFASDAAGPVHASSALRPTNVAANSQPQSAQLAIPHPALGHA